MKTDDLGPVGDTKPWWASKTIIGGGVTVAALVAGYMGVSIDEQTKAVVMEQTEALIVAGTALLGTLLAIYGRIAARKAIGR